MTAASSHPVRSSHLVVHAALAGNVAVAITKLCAAIATGSSAMFSEAVHSFVDCGNEGLLLYGIKRAERRPDLVHPLGFGREIYFWSFIVALMLFALGAGVSLYQGVRHILEPTKVEHAVLSYVVLALSFAFESASWVVAWKAFNKSKGDTPFWTAFRQSKDPPAFMILFEDSAALISIIIATAGILVSQTYDAPLADGVASVLIGLILAITALLLAIESKSLLIGERATPALVEAICRVAREQHGVRHANSALTAQLAPDQALVALSIEFEDHLDAVAIEACVTELETRIRTAYPVVVALFVKPQTKRQFELLRRERFGHIASTGRSGTIVPFSRST